MLYQEMFKVVFDGVLFNLVLFITVFIAALFIYKGKKGQILKISVLMAIYIITLGSPWWPHIFNFYSVLLGNPPLTPYGFVFLIYLFIPMGIWIWFSVYYTQLHKNKWFLIIFSILGLVFYFIIFGSLWNNELLLGYLPMIFSSIGLVGNLYTGSYSFYITQKREDISRSNKKVLWKARFLSGAFLLYSLAAIYGAIMVALPFTIPGFYLMMVVLYISLFLFYLGFFIPERLAKILIKEYPEKN